MSIGTVHKFAQGMAPLTAASKPAPSRRHTLRTIWIGVLVFTVAILGTAEMLAQRARRDALDAISARATSHIAAAETALNRTLFGVDRLLGEMGELLADPGQPRGLLNPDKAQRLLLGLTRHNPFLRDLVVMEPSGQVLVAARTDALQLGLKLPPDFARQTLAQVAPQLAISDPVHSFVTNAGALFLARPLRLASGERLLVVAELPLPMLATLLTPSGDSTGLSVSLERDDGQLLVSVPPADPRAALVPRAPLAAPQLDGQAHRSTGRGDATAVIVVARPLVYPALRIAASVQIDAALAPWRSARMTIFSVAGAFVAMVLLSGALVQRQIGRLAAVRAETERARHTLEQALASMTDAFLLCDANDRVQVWNERYVETFPWTRDVIRVGLPFASLMETAAEAMVPGTEPQHAARRATWWQLRMDRHQRACATHEQEMTDGRVIAITERRTPDGSIVGVSRDVTTHERALRHAKVAAEAANVAKSQFLAAMSHEMHTPLNGVLGMNRLMLATPLTREQRDCALTIRALGSALLAIINDVLDLSRIEAGEMRLETVDFDPHLLVDEVVGALAPRAHEKGITLHSHCEANVADALRGDAGRLRQVLFNLIGNAVKFTEHGAVTVHTAQAPAALDHHGDAQIELRIAVLDTGIGIEAHALAQLFERFTQADASSARRYGGSGVGLALSRDIVTLMGGQIEVDSQPGVGSTFQIRVPMQLGEAALIEATDSITEIPADMGGLRVLVAEDNEVNQIVIAALLKQLGHSCEVVSDGRVAVQRVAAEQFDLVLMDIQMPELDGVAAAREIRRLHGAAARVPIVALTANATPQERDAYLGAGMDDSVSKPISSARLAQVIARVTQAT